MIEQKMYLSPLTKFTYPTPLIVRCGFASKTPTLFFDLASWYPLSQI